MTTLRDKFRGCIAASWIGSAMGAPVEGWPRERIQETYGYLDRLLPYRHYPPEWERPAGTTEDGIERQRLIATAIIEKQDRILALDLVAVWLRDLDPETMAHKQEPFDRSLLEIARAGVPPAELGRMWLHPNQISLGRASHPLGLINAADPRAAADDTHEVGQLYAVRAAPALRWASLYNAAIAEACAPRATVESVIEVARRFAGYRAEAGSIYTQYDSVERLLNHALDLAAKHTDPMAMRDEFYLLYEGGSHFVYSMSDAGEIISKGLAIFSLTRADPRQAILAAVNFGRDTDCLAAVAGGLSGALSGMSGIPPEWVAQVNEATRADPYTNSRRTIEETADALFAAFLARRRRLSEYLEATGAPGFLA